MPLTFHNSRKFPPLFPAKFTIIETPKPYSTEPYMTLDLTECEFLACDYHIIGMICDLEAAKNAVKA